MLSVSDNKHGSGAGYGVTGDAYPNDVSVNNVPTTAGAAGSGDVQGMNTHPQATTPQTGNTNIDWGNERIDWSVSESSPTQPAMAQRPGSEGPLRGRFRRSPSTLGSKIRGRLAMRSPSTTNSKRGSPARSLLPRRPAERMESPAAERVKIPLHRIIRPQPSAESNANLAVDTIENRFAALEQQQNVDHQYLQQMANAIRSLYEAQEWERMRRTEIDDQTVTMDMNLRRELAATREELQGIYTKIPGMTSQELQNFFAKIAEHSDMVDGKILKIEQVLNEMQGKGAKVESYLSQLHVERAKEGQAVVELVQKDVSQVRAMVNRFEPPHGNPNLTTHAHGIPFTQQMDETLAEMEKKVISHDVMQASMSETLMRQSTYEERITAIETQILQLAEQASAAGWPSSTCGTCGTGAQAPTSGAWTSWRGSSAGGAGAPGSSGDGGSEHANILQRVIGGNGQCHCAHVRDLILEVEKIKQGSSDPWTRASQPHCPQESLPAQRVHRARGERRTLPLTLKGPLGALNFKERALFDDKISMQGDFSFNGVKGGLAWKGKIERYFISRVPILKTILEWAEEEELYEITEERFEEATRGTLVAMQVQTLNAAIWGFLSGAVSGTAETMFKGASTLNGLDAWRRLARSVDHGRAMRLETLRREVKMIHLRPIPSLEKVAEGVAEFENVMNEYIQVGGTPTSPEEKKSDLLAVLPMELRETLLWRATDEGSFESFRDMVLTQCGKVLMNRKRLPVNNVNHESPVTGNEQEGDNEGFTDLNSVEGILAALTRAQKNSGRYPRRQRTGDGGGGSGAQRTGQPPRGRQCPNCSETHEGRCTKPAVAVADRKCWTCGQKGCQSSRCPQKKSVKAIEDGPVLAVAGSALRGFYMLDDEGFQKVQPGKKSSRPRPTQATLGSFISENKFKALGDTSISTSTPPTTPTASTPPTSSSTAPAAPSAAVSAPPESAAPRRQPRAVQPAKRIFGWGCTDDCKRHIPREPDIWPPIEDKAETVLAGIAEAQQVMDELEAKTRADTAKARQTLDEPEAKARQVPALGFIMEEDEGMLGAATEEVTIRAAADSGAVANVIHPAELPCDASPEPNTTGRHFVGANNTRIEKFGSCKTKLVSEHGAVGCDWMLADVSRPLHSVSTITGPEDGPPKQDFLFNNRRGVVVPPGIVDEILKKIAPITEYKREGNLYIGEFKMSSFTRQGPKA